MNQRFRLKFHELVTRLWVCIRVYTGKDEVCVQKYKDFCLDTYMLILSNFNNDKDKKWIQIRPTVHSLLAHTWELIKENKETGLGEYTEGPLENNNKFLRFNRQFLARKFSQKANLTDCLTRAWNISDPLVRAIEPMKLCNSCGKTGHYTVSCHLKGVDQKDTAQTLQSWFIDQLLVWNIRSYKKRFVFLVHHQRFFSYTCTNFLIYNIEYVYPLLRGGYSSEMPMSAHGLYEPAFFVCLIKFTG